MKAYDFISDIADMIGEDFTYNPTWTRADLLTYLRKTLKRFSELTLIVDYDSLRYVDSTTGESNVPANFLNSYYHMYDKVCLDSVQLGELDFVLGSWSLGTTGTSPLASTVMGTGRDAIVRLVPVPSNVSGMFGAGSITSITLADSGGTLWEVTVSTTGVLSTTVTTGTGDTIVLVGPTTRWDLSVNTSGVLLTTASSSSSGNYIILTDSSSQLWGVAVDDNGVLVTYKSSYYGKVVRLEVDGVNQDFSSNYGVVTNTFAQGVSSTPTAVSRLDSPFGTTMMGRTSDGNLHVWYKAIIDDVPNSNSEIYLNDCFIPIIQHGVLALAYGTECAGKDADKAKAFEAIFQVECESVRRIFNRK